MELRADGRALLVMTSDIDFVRHVADRVGILQSGRKIAELSHGEFLAQSVAQIRHDYSNRSIDRDVAVRPVR